MDISRIKKRDGRIVQFETDKIAQAIFKAAKAVGGKDFSIAQELADKVIEIAQYVDDDEIATVEGIQDLVEKVLVKNGHYKTQGYILYRKQHDDIRKAGSYSSTIRSSPIIWRKMTGESRKTPT